MPNFMGAFPLRPGGEVPLERSHRGRSRGLTDDLLLIWIRIVEYIYWFNKDRNSPKLPHG